MIQQISSAAVLPSAQVQGSQQKGSTGVFESLMKSSVSKLTQEKSSLGNTSAKKFEPDDKKDTDKKTSSGSVQSVLLGADFSSLAALLQQAASTAQPGIFTAQTSGGVQADATQTINTSQTVNSTQGANSLQADNTAQNANTTQVGGTAQGANLTQTANTTQPTAVSQQAGVSAAEKNASSLPEINAGVQTNSAAQQQVPSIVMTNTGKDISAGQQAKSDSAGSAQSQVQPAQTIQAEITSLSGAAIESAGGTPQAMQQKNQNGTVSGLKQTVAQTKQNSVDSSTKLTFDAKIQDASLSVKKTNVTDDDTASQNQGSTSFSDLFQNGNVVIQVSDKAADATKSASSQVVENIQSNYKAGNSEFTIDLFPQNLGKVSVKLTSQSGVLTVEIAAANPKTQSMLMANTGEIKSILQSTVDQPVQVLQPSQDKAWYQQPDQPNHSAQQQEQQQNRDERVYLGTQESDSSADDFLSVMQQLNQQAYSL